MAEVFSPVNIKERQALDVRAGDTVRVHQKIQEKGKTRIQIFEGLVLAVKHGKEAGGTFTVRRVASGVGVEKIFPIYSPMIDKIEIVKRSKVRRAKLYHIRDKAAKDIRRQMRNIREVPDMPEIEEEVLASEAPEVTEAEVVEEKPDETPSEETSTEDKKEE
ncbi:MAG: 50S ribosomal protein L19 [Candidatus Zambryskibacteria bacterium CG10_big_fil_rev_8_21_14_0_10_42_12]|uniref:50S ribosomal protein L19 n=1 Tax=Candidatus Zambryskibacteria bacterium CG10_big_fil_rev_8_21_14_0_10_42_12 TaxID=1975115 RepID=A0A2H0QWW5_9BACT|nr:MAG: 50S ribosomal protein L19 [Candidatus Zambryskibacteria bacterium CG10_big_fil_rev_8_21_14_0_10_42_12]